MTKTETFLAVKKSNLGIGLKSIDILIISQIDEYTRNGCDCYVTNKQFSEMFGESERSVVRAIEKLEDMQIIKRDTKYVSGNGRGNRQRVLTLNDRYKWNTGDNGNANMTLPSDNGNANMAQPLYDGNAKSEEWKRHNGVIKENLKENLLKEKKDAPTELTEKRAEKRRALEKLSDSELDSLLEKYKAKESYSNLYKYFNLEFGCLTKELPSKIEEIRKDKEKKEEERVGIDAKSALENDSYTLSVLAKIIGCTDEELLSNVSYLGASVDKIVSVYGDSDFKSIYNKEAYEDKYSNLSSDFWTFVREGIKANYKE